MKLSENHEKCQNRKNGENGKIEMRPFGTLYEPPGSQKKCSEHLRSRSTDGVTQKVHRGQEKYQNGQYVFGFWDRYDNALLLTVDFFAF